MVKKAKEAIAAFSASLPTAIPDCSPAKITLTALPAGSNLHRIHNDAYAGNAFNDFPSSNARFSTIRDESGSVIPTLYTASTFEAGLLETVFHDVPYEPGDKFVFVSALDEKTHTTLATTKELTLADLTTKALRKLGIKPEALVTSDKCDYPYSRAVAEEIYKNNPKAQGLRWVSRQDNTAYAYLLFEPRIDPACLTITSVSRSLMDDDVFDEVLVVAETIGVDVVPDS